ncbi:MAG: hypothetical protein ACTSWY_00325 [Promethearchaeota archaeon]
MGNTVPHFEQTIEFNFMGNWHYSYDYANYLTFKDSSGNTLFYFKYYANSGWAYWKFQVLGASTYWCGTNFG